MVALLIRLSALFAAPNALGLFLPRGKVNILISNDDGWAEANIRAQYGALTSAGYNVVLSAPVQNQSGTGSLDAPPASPMTEAGEFGSVPTGAPGIGFNSSDAHLNYVNSYPVTATKYGIDTLGPRLFGRAPDIVSTGPNVGSNLGFVTLFSGTVGAATEAIKKGIPAIAFSGVTGDQRSYTTLSPGDYSTIYAAAATKILGIVINSGAPYLPSSVALNVNFPAIDSTNCSKASDFNYVLSRVYFNPIIFQKDVTTCDSSRLPLESTVIKSGGCHASVSIFTMNKLDSGVAEQAVILQKFKTILTCL